MSGDKRYKYKIRLKNYVGWPDYPLTLYYYINEDEFVIPGISTESTSSSQTYKILEKNGILDNLRLKSRLKYCLNK